MTTAVIRYLGQTCGSSYTAGDSKCAGGCKCPSGICENDQTKKNCPARRQPIEQMIEDEPLLSKRKPQKMQQNQEEEQATSTKTVKAGKGEANPRTKAYEQIYGDDYVQQRGVGGYIPMYDAPYHYEQVQPVYQPMYQPQLASSTNPDSMQFGLMLLGLGLFLCLAICIVFVLLSAVCFVVGRFSNAKKSDKIEYEELAV
eukprot:1061026_1